MKAADDGSTAVVMEEEESSDVASGATVTLSARDAMLSASGMKGTIVDVVGTFERFNEDAGGRVEGLSSLGLAMR